MGGVTAVRLASIALASSALAGCFSDRGLAIEIDVGGTGATSVELFIGKTACSSDDSGIDCRAIAPPPMNSALLRGDIWFRDELALDTAQVNGHTAAFQLRSDDAVTIPIIIAAGMVEANGVAGNRVAVASATLHDVAVPVNSARVVTSTLIPAHPVQPGAVAKNVTEDRVIVWPKMTPPSACVAVEHWEGGTATRTFVVPREDPDCDDVALECNPAAFHGTAPEGTAPRPDCLTTDSGACVLGSRACTDGIGTRTGTCAAQHDSRVCAPSVFCAACTEIDALCMKDAFTVNPMAVPHLECEFPAQQNLTVCAGKDQAAVQLDSHFPPTQTCTQPLLASLSLSGFATTAAFSGALLEVTSPQRPCSFAIKWKANARTTGDTIDFGVIRVGSTSGKVLVPVVLRFNASADACTNLAPTCTLKEVVDPLWSCAQ